MFSHLIDDAAGQGSSSSSPKKSLDRDRESYINIFTDLFSCCCLELGGGGGCMNDDDAHILSTTKIIIIKIIKSFFPLRGIHKL